MAIYKPSNCAPFLGASDFREPVDISCEINTSNVPITGYKIKILDNLNNIIFEGKDFTLASDSTIQSYGNTWLNGSLLKLPLIITNDTARNVNTIYYNSEDDKYYGGNDMENPLSNFMNGYVYQPYKWVITLAQGELSNTNAENKYLPKDNSAYDMLISSGNFLGSTTNRIQTWKSDYIYKDYYLQLYQYTEGTTNSPAKETKVGTRALIKDYDNSYGFIYPQTNSIPKTSLEQANRVKIFKNTNNPIDVKAAGSNRLVDYISYVDLTQIKIGNSSLKSGEEFNPVNIENEYTTFTQKYSPVILDTDFTLDKYVNGAPKVMLTTGMSILFVNQGSKNAIVSNKAFYYSPYNGVFALKSKENITDDTGNYTLLTWERPSPWQLYSSYIDSLILITGNDTPNTNYFCTANGLSAGEINKTSLKFFEETPIGLYPYLNKEKEEIPQVWTKSYPTSSPLNFTEIWEVELTETGVTSKPNINNIAFLCEGEGPETEGQKGTKGINIDQKYKINVIPLGGNYIYVNFNNVTYTGTSLTNIELKFEITAMQDYGEVFKNTETTTYIKPYNMLSADMKLFHGNNLSKDLDIITIDNTPNVENKFNPTWYITHKALETPFTPIADMYTTENAYEIRSFFKFSDANPFYGYNKSVLKISKSDFYYNNANDDGDIRDLYNVEWIFTLSARVLNCTVDFSQEQNKTWQYYYWELYNISNDTYVYTDKTYNGTISCNIDGLLDKNYYLATCYVNDELGNQNTLKICFYVDLNITEDHKIKLAFNCNSQSVILEYTGNIEAKIN